MRIATLKEIEKALEKELESAQKNLATAREHFRHWDLELDNATNDEEIDTQELESIRENYGYYKERKEYWLDKAQEIRSALEDFQMQDWR